MTALADNQPFVKFSPFLQLWVAWGYGFWATGDDHHEAVQIWHIIYNTMGAK